MLDISNAFFIIAGSIGLILIACGNDNNFSDKTRWILLVLATIIYIIGTILVALKVTLG